MSALRTATPAEQLQQLQFGTVDFVSRAEILAKLEGSYNHQRPLAIKFGADPSRADLHLGHTVVLNKLRQFQDFGHQVDFVIGDFTALIGDPTGKNETRPALSTEEIAQNATTYSEQVFKVLRPEATRVVYNSKWLAALGGEGFIRLSAQYTVARMLERDDFTKRFAAHVPISLHELLYPLFQGYDSVALKSDIELGGTDQKFNLLVGRELQKAYGQPAQQGVITTPILEGLDGVQKMSKSLDNCISLVESPKDMFGKTMRIQDAMMFRWWELLTHYSPQEISGWKSQVEAGALHPRQLKVNLAKYLVSRFHSSAAAEGAEQEFQRMFVDKGTPDEVPEFLVALSEAKEVSLVHVLQKAGLVPSVSEARRLVRGNAVEIDQVRITDESYRFELKGGQGVLIKAGKRKFLRVRLDSK